MSLRRTTATAGLVRTLVLGSALHFINPGFTLAGENPTLYETHLSNAERGDPQAQTVLGNMYHDGFGIQRDQEKALYWYRQAAAQNHPEGLHQLAHEYSQGHGITRDSQKAFELFLKAAEQGHAKSQYRVSYHYLSLQPQDVNTAFKWASKSAEQGYGKAQELIGEFYEKGIVVDSNIDTAFEFYSKAADQGHTGAMVQAATLVLHGRVQGDLDQIVDYVKKAARADIALAQFYLGQMYRHGYPVEQDLESAYNWHKRAAENDNIDSQFALGEMYLAGEIIDQDYDLIAAYSGSSIESIYREEAYNWFRRAADKGHSEAKQMMKKHWSSR